MIWEDHVDLADGTRIYVRVIRPSDRPTFRAGWERLSEQSRLFRFLAPRASLSEAELDYLTDVDGIDHYAVGAVTRDADGHEGPVATARFVRYEDRPKKAEFAITVIDEYQHHGVGRILLERLLKAARKRGYEALVADVLGENTVARHLIERVAPNARSVHRGGMIRFEIPLVVEEDEPAS